MTLLILLPRMLGVEELQLEQAAAALAVANTSIAEGTNDVGSGESSGDDVDEWAGTCGRIKCNDEWVSWVQVACPTVSQR